jgi:CheY-like chemotaxis protein
MAGNLSPSVLVVDDDPDDQMLLLEAFKASGLQCNLEFSVGGPEALARLRQPPTGQPLIVLLDMNMPGMDGLEFLSRRTREPALRRIPVIALTTSWDETLVNKAYDLGANAFLVKPMRFAELVELVRSFSSFWLVTAELPSAAG